MSSYKGAACLTTVLFSDLPACNVRSFGADLRKDAPNFDRSHNLERKELKKNYNRTKSGVGPRYVCNQIYIRMIIPVSASKASQCTQAEYPHVFSQRLHVSSVWHIWLSFRWRLFSIFSAALCLTKPYQWSRASISWRNMSEFLIRFILVILRCS